MTFLFYTVAAMYQLFEIRIELVHECIVFCLQMGDVDSAQKYFAKFENNGKSIDSFVISKVEMNR